MFKIIHKHNECIGCYLCAEVAPNYFFINEDGIAELHNPTKVEEQFEYGDLFPEDLAALKKAEEGCPTQIIRVEE